MTDVVKGYIRLMHKQTESAYVNYICLKVTKINLVPRALFPLQSQ